MTDHGTQTEPQVAPGGAAGFLHSRAAVVVDSISDADRTVEVVASNEEVDRHGTILRANWRLESFRANPVVLYAHDACDLPIGTASDVRVTEKGELRAKLTFSVAELNPRAEQVWQNVKQKVLRGVSVGFFPHTVTMERHEDREVFVLDDNELFEISVVPVPSNPGALADMRARALRLAPSQEPTPTAAVAAAPVVTEQEPTPEPPAPLPSPAQEPPEKTNMTDTNEPNHATPTVARALGLPTGATESDIVVAITRCRELELQIMGITGAQLTAEAVGALRGIKAKADRCDAIDAELTQVKAERDQQNFDALVMKGQSNPVKLTPATAKMYADEFTAAKADGRGSEVVARLRGFLDVAPTIHALSRPAGAQPAVRGTGASAPTTHNGKAYAELKPLERARLAQSEPELFRAMKNEHEASQASA